MKKLAIAVCVVATPFLIYCFSIILPTVFSRGLTPQALVQLLLLGGVLTMLGLVGAGLGAVVDSSLKVASGRREAVGEKAGSTVLSKKA